MYTEFVLLKFQIYPTESANAGYLASTLTSAVQMSNGNVIVTLIVTILIICLHLLVDRIPV